MGCGGSKTSTSKYSGSEYLTRLITVIATKWDKDGSGALSIAEVLAIATDVERQADLSTKFSTPESAKKAVKEIYGTTDEKKIPEDPSQDIFLGVGVIVQTLLKAPEGLPDDCLADVGRDEEGDTGSKTIPLLKEFVLKQQHVTSQRSLSTISEAHQADDDQTGNEKLHDDEDGVSGTKVLHFTVHTGENVSHGLTNGDQDAENCTYDDHDSP